MRLKRYNILAICFLLFLAFGSKAQSTQSVYFPVQFNTNAQDFSIVINDQYIKRDSIVYLEPGSYKVSLYADRVQKIEDSIPVSPIRINKFNWTFKGFNSREEIKEYDLNQYQSYEIEHSGNDDSALVQVFGDFDDVSVVVDNEKFHKNRFFKVAPGEHVLKIWTPNNEIIVDTVQTKRSMAFQKSYTFEKTEAYKKTWNLRKEYFKKRKIHTTIGTSLGGVGAVYSVISIALKEKAAKDYNFTYQKRYSIVFGDDKINEYKTDLNNLYSKYKSWKSQMIIGLVMTGVGISYSIGSAIFFSEKRAPHYDKSRPQWEKGLELGVNSNGIGLKFNF